MSERPEGITLRPYDPSDDADRQALWDHKIAFETGLGTGTGGDEKAAKYESKLDDAYRRRWLSWVDRCIDDEDRCLLLAEAAADAGTDRTDGVVGYIFLLPERLAFIWDAAVINELYVAPNWRGEGVADALIEAAVDVARGQDLPLDRLLLDVDRDNERAYAFYERHGFEPWGEIVAREL
ncbi:GNAT family N-acetyltransferase [Natronomonas amylolytica]|uniref:GNAT family N-acetyltransferase n=1 Tax=Natronomonas amylolytica TaxID=3108498 RepID=UPI00300A6751